MTSSGKWFDKWRRGRRVASATALTLLLGTLVVLAYQHDGKPFTEVELNDGGVWVTNRDMGLVARLNPQIKELDLGVDATSTDFDIFQRETDLYVDDASSERAVKPVDVATAVVLDPTTLPTGAVVANGGETFAVVDAVTGKAWVRSADGFRGFSAKSTPPDLKNALSATVGTDGRAYVLDRKGVVTPFTIDESGSAVAGDEIELGDHVGTDPAMVALTVVGDTPVLFNRSTLELTRPGADPVAVDTPDPSEVELQQPSDDADELYLATREGLEVTPVSGGDLKRISRGTVAGRPAAPVHMTGTGCVYAAWSDPQSPNNYLRDCEDDSDDDTSPLPAMQPGAFLQFRVNRDVIVLNDAITGDSWLVQEPGKAKIDNWPAVDPQNQNKSKLKETTEEIPDQENRPPEPQNDDLGARPGRSTVLPVVALNDHDPDGDIISISKTQHVSGPELEVRIVGGGTQLQVAVPADAVGTSVFRYYVTDGRVNEEVWAEVHLTIRDNGANAKPQMMEDREPVLTVASGATSSYYLLADFFDMDGDDLTLTEATARGGEVEFRPDGTITFSDTGAGAKVTEIDYTIEDGFDDVLNGKLKVQILGATAPPELVPDLASGVADSRVVVQPLTNDRNPEGGDLTLKSVKVVGDDQGTEISKDLESGTFTFYSSKARSYYLEYTAYNSSATEKSFIRLDIESPPKDNRPPVAVRDKAVITAGGTAQVDLLLNDLDPDGDVLVVKRVGRPSIPGVKVSIVDKRLAVVSSATDIVGQQATVDYVVSDGRSSTVGQLVIAQRRATQENRHPIANKDQVTVRAGSVTTVPVLGNDSDPDGGKPRLFQSELINDQDLDVWVAGDTLRLRAPEEPGNYSVIYGVRDVDGLKASAEVSIYVVADSAKNNHPPLPQPIIDRVIAGRPKVISVDLVGADPDGDAVSFRSILTAPSFGRVLDTGVDWIRYEAFENKTGTDFFQIMVQDKYGATGVAEVRVGVVPEETENQAPVALDDNVLVQPNRTISYNVLTNDVDPDDDPLRVEELNSTASPEPKHENGFVELEVGEAPELGVAATNVGYTIQDAGGATDQAVLKVTASRNAPFYAPIARDDVAELGEIIGREPGAMVEVPVLDNDLDFDGAKADLEVSGCDAGSKGTCEVVGKATVRVELKAEDQIVLYSLDDADEESTGTFGVIYVTGTENVPPQLTTDKSKVPVKAVVDKPVVFDLKDIVVTRAGREPSIAADATPTAVNGAVEAVEGEPTSLSFMPARGHVGPASVTVSVTDGRTSAEDGALSSLLTIPIDVEPSENVAPTMRDAAVDVTADGDAAEVDLAGLTRDANEDDLSTMKWTVESADSGLEARIESDSVLSVKAGGGAKDGETLRVVVIADDGHGGTDEAVVTARIVDSDRPLLDIPPINVTGDEGKSMVVDVAEYAVNPYPGEPIKVSKPVLEGDGRLADLKADGSEVSFTPTATGTSTIKVTVADASGDKAREVPARINVEVIDVPGAPQRPVLSSVEASSAVLSWREPDSNGAPIDEYKVTGPGYEQSCSSPTCRLVGLTPGKAYTFTVRAHNSEGWGEASPASEEVVPNKAPDVMSPPTIVNEPKPTGGRMDRQLTLRWSPPANEGSPITAYEIKEAGSSRTWQAGGNERSMTIGGLTNGTPYAFEIRAINEVEPRRQFSGPSKAVAPFGIPMRSGSAPQLTASEDSPFTAEPWVRVEWPKWSESQSNGSAVSSYTITCSGCSRSTYVVDASTSSKTFDVNDGIEKGKTVTFTVAATNDAGTSDKSPSVSGRPWTKAGPVRNLREIGESPSDRTATIAWDPPADDGGLSIRHYVVQSETGSTTVVGSAPGNGTAIQFPTNATHSIKVWAVTFNGDRAVEGESDSLGGIDTWGKPGTPSLRYTTSNSWYSVDFSIEQGDANGKPVTGVEISVDGGAFEEVSLSQPYRIDVGEGGTERTIRARTVSTASGDRQYSDVVPLTARSKPKELTLSWEFCNANRGGCLLAVDGKGFFKSPQSSQTQTTISGLVEGAASGECGAYDRSVSANGLGTFSYYVGDGCRFSGNGSAKVTIRDMTAIKYLPAN
ncbi:Ig-like domain-containing protein [Nocardioides sp. R1-1]|uniref:Ig-like domain-containing protein n=1 Tax=Nocardioides sp. R1-1 TaxID=3383502 RepID=UPI0038D1EF0F